MLRVSDAEKEYIRQGVALGCRVDGRKRLEYRHVTVDVGVIEQAAGSARVAIHGGGTDVIAAVKVELTSPQAGRADCGIVEADVETFVPVAASSQRRAMIDTSQELSSALNALLSSPGALDLRALCVVPGQLVWRVYVDLIILEAGGSLMDACTLAACAALAGTDLPKLRLVRGGEDGNRIDVDLDQDGEADASTPFPAASVPIQLTFAGVGGSTVVDTSVEEESVCDSRVRVGVNRRGEVAYVATESCGSGGGGDGGMQPQALHAAVEAARGIAAALFEQIDTCVAGKRYVGGGAEAEGGFLGGAGGFLSRGKLHRQAVVADASLRVMVPP